MYETLIRIFGLQVNQVLSILRLKNKAQTLGMDFGIPRTKFDTELQKTTSEDRVSAPANLNLTTSSLDFAVPPSPLSISSDGNFPGNESWSPKASTVGSELGLELENRVEETIPPLVKERPQLSPMELFPHLFPKVCRSYCHGEPGGYAIEVASVFYFWLDGQRYCLAMLHTCIELKMLVSCRTYKIKNFWSQICGITRL
jgi:hypothetical protein